MERITKLLTNGYVLTMNAAMEVYPHGAVAIHGDSIVAVGAADDILARYEADEVVDCQRQIIMPGLVNTHTHAPMTLLRGLADDLRLDVWLMGYMMPTEAAFVNPEFCRLGTLLACAEMIRSGITMFADMYYFEAEVAAATAQAGMRAVLGECILKFPSPDATSYEESLALTREFIEQWKGHPLVVPAVAPHAPYTCTDEILSACAKLAQEFDVPLLIHIAEMQSEVENSRKEFGMPVVPRVKKLGVLDAKTLAAHCVHLDTGEMRTLYNHNTGIAHCPSSNLKLASGIAPITEMLSLNLKVGIGTDGPASNNDLDMFEEVRLAALLAKGATGDPVVVPAKQAMTMATRLGAQAMHMGDITGSLEVGKRADIIVVDRSPLHNAPQFERDPDAVYSQLVYASKSTDVQHVMVNGTWLLKNKELLTINVESLLEDANRIAREVDKFLIAREGSVLNKLLAIGGVAQAETFEIQVKAHVDSVDVVQRLLASPNVSVVRHIHYRQYDTYFMFGNENNVRLRYREDDAVQDNGDVSHVRTRLTYTMPTKEREFDDAVMLSRSAFLAPANYPLRFYREYFRPASEQAIQKDRVRWHILYKGVLFYVNLDTLLSPKIDDSFLEIKSQTWSASDASYKATLISEILAILELDPSRRVRKEYLELAMDAVN